MWVWLLIFRQGLVRGAAVVCALIVALLLNVQAGYSWYLWFPIAFATYAVVPMIYGAFIKLTNPSAFNAEVRRATRDAAEDSRDAGRS